MALTLTDYIQTSEGSESVTGRRSVSETYIHLRLAWLSLPIAAAATSFAFLLLTMFATRNRWDSLWKDSNLALLYHGLEAAELPNLDGDSHYHHAPDNLSEMEHPPISKFTDNAGSFRHRNAPAVWCVVLLLFGLLVQGTHVSTYTFHATPGEFTLVEHDVPDNRALVNYAQHELVKRELSPG